MLFLGALEMWDNSGVCSLSTYILRDQFIDLKTTLYLSVYC